MTTARWEAGQKVHTHDFGVEWCSECDNYATSFLVAYCGWKSTTSRHPALGFNWQSDSKQPLLRRLSFRGAQGQGRWNCVQLFGRPTPQQRFHLTRFGIEPLLILIGLVVQDSAVRNPPPDYSTLWVPCSDDGRSPPSSLASRQARCSGLLIYDTEPVPLGCPSLNETRFLRADCKTPQRSPLLQKPFREPAYPREYGRPTRSA